MGTVPVPYSPVAGDDATQARVLTWADAANYLLGNATSGGARRPLAIMRQTVAQSLTTSTITAITFDTEDVDYDNGHSTVSNTSRYTAQTSGYYLVTGSVAFAFNATGERILDIVVNGATTYSRVRVMTDTASGWGLSTTAIVLLNNTDFVEMRAFQSSGGALLTDVAASQPRMAVQWISV